METFFCADTHMDHAGILKHCDRIKLQSGDLDSAGKWVSGEVKQTRLDEMNNLVFNSWNGIVGKKDLVYIVGDFAYDRHRKWAYELNGKKILIVGDHDAMPQDSLDMFQRIDWRNPDEASKKWLKESEIECDNPYDLQRTLRQFREVHGSLVRKICGQDMHLHHWPQRSWSKSTHGSWCVCGHSHGRMSVTRPSEGGGGLILDVGWDVFKRPISFDELRAEMQVKFDLLPEAFREHILVDKEGGRLAENDNPEHNPVGGVR